MCEWYPLLTTTDTMTEDDSQYMDTIQEPICTIKDLYQCLGCGYMANNRIELIAHCSMAVSGEYNGYKAHTECPAVDGLMSQAHIIINKREIPENSDIEASSGQSYPGICGFSAHQVF
jgi:hypothetical protein